MNFEVCGFEHLHRHTDGSLLDGFATPEEYALYSTKINQNFLVITDHGMMSAIPRQIRACDKICDKFNDKDKLSPIFGCELYYNEMQPEVNNSNELKLFTKDLNEDEKKKFRKSSHLLAIAYNEIGYSNLVRLSSWGWTKGFYSRPRINREMLEKHKEGIIFTSCCYASEVGRAFDEFGEDAANDVIQKYIDVIGKENYYLEIMLLDFKKQKPYNVFILKAKEKFGLKLILSQDCHYCTREDSKYQRLMLMVQTKKTLADIEKAMAENDMQDFFELQDANLWMKSEEELNEKWEKDYKDIIPYELFCEAKRETVRVCQKAKGVKLDRTIKFPEYPDADQILWEKIGRGLRNRGFTGKVPKKYSDRVKEEYSLICRKGFTTYFIIQQKMTDEARRACPEILGWGDGSEALGCGRGSAGGSLICYLLGITDVDPIEEDLLFSRFLSESRGGRRMKLEFDEEDFVEYNKP